jgi:hypothetical protein
MIEVGSANFVLVFFGWMMYISIPYSENRKIKKTKSNGTLSQKLRRAFLLLRIPNKIGSLRSILACHAGGESQGRLPFFPLCTPSE